ncbi:hypothetical protein QM480_18880 [Flectobacillus sp. DC10W]|uniref:Uncharacterized protein n=1 Tax=Flectobacillus longus TaxID=2984207 RepID=A0ABT6YTJ5_9BACT|nr:hypothetical protein [Flectobacillus longus]MDI9866413.1 hypothetical protein [Flectobacillus longus]
MNCKKHILLFFILILGYGCLAWRMKSTSFVNSGRKAVVAASSISGVNGVVKNTTPSFVLADDNETEPEHTSDLVSVVGFLPDFSAFLDAFVLPENLVIWKSTGTTYPYHINHLYVLFHEWKYLPF